MAQMDSDIIIWLLYFNFLEEASAVCSKLFTKASEVAESL